VESVWNQAKDKIVLSYRRIKGNLVGDIERDWCCELYILAELLCASQSSAGWSVLVEVWGVSLASRK